MKQIFIILLVITFSFSCFAQQAIELNNQPGQKNLQELLVFDNESSPLETKANGAFSKTMVLKTLSPDTKVKGTLVIVVAYADTKQVIAQQSGKIMLDKQGTASAIQFKCDASKRTQITYTFTEEKSGNSATGNYILPYRIANGPDDDEKGAYYDYTKTMAPERPWMVEHYKIPTMGSWMSDPDPNGGTKIYETFEQILPRIIAADNITRGLQKRFYLVGWQYNGHDDKYPAFFEVNPALKRPQDSTALQSYFWLKNEAAKHHTTLTVHINMTDAYTNSPLWDTYVKNDLIARNEDGSYFKIGEYNGLPAYQVCYTREWDAGYAQKRIDQVVELLDLKSSGSVHIDAFFPRWSKYHGITWDMETDAMRKFFRYWRDKGVDVTSEQQTRLRPDPFIGLQPWALYNDLSREQRAELPPNLVYGGGGGADVKADRYNEETGFLFGVGGCGSDKLSFCAGFLQSYYQNSRKLIHYDKEARQTIYSGGLVIDAKAWTVTENGKLLRRGNDVFFPALWRTNKEIIAFSQNGYRQQTWDLPADWANVKTVDLYSVDKDGLTLKAKNVPVSDMKITLSLQPMEELSIQAADK